MSLFILSGIIWDHLQICMLYFKSPVINLWISLINQYTALGLTFLHCEDCLFLPISCFLLKKPVTDLQEDLLSYDSYVFNHKALTDFLKAFWTFNIILHVFV